MAWYDPCTIRVDGEHNRRGARLQCGYCRSVAEVAFNTMKWGSGNDEEMVERYVASRFEKLGWKVGNSLHQHRCPKCLGARKPKEKPLKDSKIVNIVPQKTVTPALKGSTALDSTMADKADPVSGMAQQPRPMTRDERRIITSTINDHYVSETVGYEAGWNDSRIAKDLGVPLVYVDEVREQTFGPNVDEHTTQATSEARSLLNEIKSTIEAWQAKAAALEVTLKELEKRR